MRKVYICSPYHNFDDDEQEKNRQKALRYSRFAHSQGCNPFAPHTYYPEFLDDKDLEERCAGIKMALEFMWCMQELWVFGNHISLGMKEEIKLAETLNIKIRYFNEELEEI